MTQTVRVPDMMCDNCAATIRRKVEAVAGVEAFVAKPAEKLVAVTGSAAREAILAAIRDAGFKPEA